tara:strand:- start:228 stop:560 length:333 start_codon:yes stop_codon:yes gene_type:complete
MRNDDAYSKTGCFSSSSSSAVVFRRLLGFTTTFAIVSCGFVCFRLVFLLRVVDFATSSSLDDFDDDARVELCRRPQKRETTLFFSRRGTPHAAENEPKKPTREEDAMDMG